MSLTAAFLILAHVSRYDLVKDAERPKGQPYERYFTHDRLGRKITFYVTERVGSATEPLVVFVQGSGNGSNFVKLESGRIVPQNGQTTMFDVAKGAIRLLIVEKPGVKYLDDGKGGVRKDAQEFRREHTLDRWAEAVSASLRAAQKLPGIDHSRTLVMGHSEGGLVACRVAAMNPKVTHLATLAGGGVSQLYDLIALARKGLFGAQISPDPEQRVAYLTSEWKKVLADPTSADKDFLGHPYRRWSRFLATSPLEELTKYKGRIYIGQGLDDAAVDPSSADVLYAQLLTRGKDVTYDRIPGVNHSFTAPDDHYGKGWTDEMKRVFEWFMSG